MLSEMGSTIAPWLAKLVRQEAAAQIRRPRMGVSHHAGPDRSHISGGWTLVEFGEQLRNSMSEYFQCATSLNISNTYGSILTFYSKTLTLRGC